MIFRIANRDDCSKLDNLLTKLIHDERKYDDTIDSNFVVKDFYINVIDNDDRRLYVCVDNDVIIGYAYIILNKKTSNLDALYVLEEYRNKGIATKLMELCIAYSKDNNIYNVNVSVLVDNISAKCLYKKFLFKAFKETMKLDIRK